MSRITRPASPRDVLVSGGQIGHAPGPKAHAVRHLPAASADAPAGAHPPGASWPHFTPPAGEDDDDERNESADPGRVHQVRTTVAEAGCTKPAGIPASVFEVASQPEPQPAPAPKTTPSKRIRPESMQIDVDVPLAPLNRHREDGAAYRRLIARMRPGHSVLLSVSQAARLVTEGKKSGFNMVRRKAGDKQCRVWRLADDAAAGAAP